jgi:uncharacterized membrane protein
MLKEALALAVICTMLTLVFAIAFHTLNFRGTEAELWFAAATTTALIFTIQALEKKKAI